MSGKKSLREALGTLSPPETWASCLRSPSNLTCVEPGKPSERYGEGLVLLKWKPQPLCSSALVFSLTLEWFSGPELRPGTKRV